MGIFLPPRQHLLLEFRPMNGKTVVTMATDDWADFGSCEFISQTV